MIFKLAYFFCSLSYTIYNTLCYGAFLITFYIMCVSPVKIKNPNKGLSFAPGTINSFKDCTSSYINVPCGHCFECISSRKMKLCQRAQMMSRFSHCFFLTFTYNNEHLPSLDINGFNIRYADISDAQRMFKRFRNEFDLPFKYLLVSERGAKNGRPHFHALIFIPKECLPDYYSIINMEAKLKSLFLSLWAQNVGSDKKPIYDPLCTYVEKFRNGKLNRTFDCHYVQPSILNDGCSDVVYYITKYLLKNVGAGNPLQQALRLNLDEDVYRDVWHIVKDKCVYSKNFGLRDKPEVLDYLRFSLDTSIADVNCVHPSFVDCDSGNLVPMCKFYQDVSVTFDDALEFYNRKHRFDDDVDTMSFDDRDLSAKIHSIHRGDDIVSLNDDLSLFDDSDFLFN